MRVRRRVRVVHQNSDCAHNHRHREMLGVLVAAACWTSPSSLSRASSRMPFSCMVARDGIPSDVDALAALSLPTRPSPDLAPNDVVHAICCGLQHVNMPAENDGLRRVYEFTTYECRASLTSRKGYKSGVERFVQFAELYTLVGCLSFATVGDTTIIPGTQTRGALASIAVDVSEALSFRGPSGFERTKPPGEQGDIKVERYSFQLACERRPPLAGCWLVTSIMPMREHMMFNGDSGAVQG